MTQVPGRALEDASAKTSLYTAPLTFQWAGYPLRRVPKCFGSSDRPVGLEACGTADKKVYSTATFLPLAKIRH